MMSERDLELIKRIKKYCLNIEDIKTNLLKILVILKAVKSIKLLRQCLLCKLVSVLKISVTNLSLNTQLFRGIVLLVYAIYMRTNITILTIQ